MPTKTVIDTMCRLLCKYLLCLGFLSFGTLLYGQDAVYSQFYLSPTLLNPAFAGNTHSPFVAVNYRNQWPSINQAYSTYSVAYDQQWKSNSGVGIYVNSDNAGAGAIKTTKVAGIYSYKIRLNTDTYLKGAIEAGYGQTSLDWQQLVFFDSLDPQFGATSPGGVTIPSNEIPADNLSRSFFDIGTGVLIYNPRWYAGVSLKHANSPTIDFIDDQTGRDGQLPSRLTVHGGMQINLDGGNRFKGSTFISPNALVSVQGDFWQVMAGAYVNVDQVFGGLWYRQGGANGDAVIGSIGIKSGIFKIGYSYDYTVSELTIGSGGSHEIGVTMLFDMLKPREFQYSDCLNLFR